MKKVILALTFILIASACATTGPKVSGPVLKLEDQTEAFARDRAANVKNVSYDLNLTLSKDKTLYSGEQKIIFDLRELKDIYLDFQGGEIIRAVVNGDEVKLERGPVFVKLPQKMLRHERNLVTLTFTHEHSRSGTGFHRFVDPEDQNVYLYTDFEPFNASQMAPFFDQPDIKATLGLNVEAPSDWQVVGNGRIFSAKMIENGNKKWQFQRTKPISTYLFAVMAGPYVYRESSYKKIPLRIYSRKTMAKYVPYDEWFQITRQGLQFYEEYFQVPYAFGKYDQIVVPEFGSGAMENAGAITFTERYMKRGQFTRYDKVYLYNVVLHEMAHQWFGNLVTMRWWNDLWLNESFATFMAPLAQEKATQYKEAWQFYREDKVAALRQDQSSTTHPIAATVANTNEAFTNFDDITYGKGAAVLTQLHHYLGADEFKKGIREYFKTYAWQNTELKDFISAFERTSATDLKPWFKVWLESTGVDQIQASVDCTQASTVDVSLKFNSKTELRPQAFRVLLLNEKNGLVQKPQVLDFKRTPEDLKNSTTTKGVAKKDLQCPQFVYPNYRDHAYFEVQFDESSMAFLEKNLAKIEDALTRQAIWYDLWEAVRDQRLSLARYSQIALANLKTESSLDILSFIESTTTDYGHYDSVYYFWPKSTEVERASFLNEAKKYESLLEDRLKNLSPKSDLYKTLTGMWISSLETPEGFKKAEILLSTLQDSDLRWATILAICGSDSVRAEGLVDTELAKDKSDEGQKNALVCRAKNPDSNQKQNWVNQLTSAKITYSADEVRKVATNLFYGSQRDRIEKFSGEIYSALRSKWSDLDEAFQSRLVSGLAPVYCDAKAHETLEKFMASNKSLPATMLTPLQEKLDEDRVCLAVRQKAGRL